MKNQNGLTGSHDRPGKPSLEQIDLILEAQRAAGIDTWKSMERLRLLAIAAVRFSRQGLMLCFQRFNLI